MQISVIIPTLNEELRIADAVARTRMLGNCEVIVVDGGSSDGTVGAANDADLVLTSERGRANQQNAGAAAACGDALLFLHADCWLDRGSLESMCAALVDEACVGGCFQQRIDAAGWAYRMLERGNALRVKCWKWAYGDQGIFVRRSIFEQLGGFPTVALMEDLLFMKRLKRQGRVALLNPRINISARRWKRQGILGQTARNWFLIALLHCGVSPDRLARFYPQVR